jgi:hypothetical protein
VRIGAGSFSRIAAATETSVLPSNARLPPIISYNTAPKKLSFQFDQVRLGSLTIPITTTLRAVASRSEVLAATPPLTSSEYADNQIQIGGDQISYGEGGPVMVGSQVVGRYTSQGVLANADQDWARHAGPRSMTMPVRKHFGSSR